MNKHLNNNMLYDMNQHNSSHKYILWSHQDSMNSAGVMYNKDKLHNTDQGNLHNNCLVKYNHKVFKYHSKDDMFIYKACSRHSMVLLYQ